MNIRVCSTVSSSAYSTRQSKLARAVSVSWHDLGYNTLRFGMYWRNPSFRGAHIDINAAEGYTPLHRAARGTSGVSSLLECGAEIDGTSRETPLHFAAGFNGSVSIVKLLLNRGADVGARDDWGDTPWQPFMPIVFGYRGSLAEIGIHSPAQRGRVNLSVIELLLIEGRTLMPEPIPVPPHCTTLLPRSTIRHNVYSRGANIETRNKLGEEACWAWRQRGSYMDDRDSLLCR